MGEIVGGPVGEASKRNRRLDALLGVALSCFLFGWLFRGSDAPQQPVPKPTLVYFDVGEDRGAKLYYKGEWYYALLVSGKDDWIDADGKTLISSKQLGSMWGVDQEELNGVYHRIIRQRRGKKLIEAASNK